MMVRQATGGGSHHLRTPRQRHLPILSVLMMLDVFVLGGVVALVLVNRLLSNQLAVYAPYSMDAASAILDVMEDLFPYYVVCIVGLLALVLITLGVWAWLRTDSWLLRYGVALLVLTILVVGAWTLLSHGAGGDPVPPLTPTPVAATVGTSSQAGLAQERGPLPRWGAVSKDTFAS
jgi:hypothetical protein